MSRGTLLELDIRLPDPGSQAVFLRLECLLDNIGLQTVFQKMGLSGK